MERLLRSPLGGAKARSLIITFMGDVVSVQQRPAWLGGLVAALAPFGLSEHLVRTTCNRLIKEGWLRSQRIGRRSYCRFSSFGARQYQRAAGRIYAPAKPAWDGYWTLIPTAGLARQERERLAEQLGWLGFGRMRGDLLIRAGYGEEHRQVLRELRVQAPVFRAQGVELLGSAKGRLPQLCREVWAVDELNEAYRRFLESLAGVTEGAAPTPRQAFMLRLRLIHEFRRIVLIDPELPASLLPADWRGDAARQRATVLYHHWLDASEAWLAGVLQPQGQDWTDRAAVLRARFRHPTWTACRASASRCAALHR